MNVIETNQLKKYYHKSRGISNVTFFVKEGEIFGFVGPNGAGKTTLIRSVLGLIQYQSGEISVLGYDPSNDSEKMNENIGYLPSEVYLYPEMKASEVIHFYSKMKKCDLVKATMLTSRFGLDTSKKVSELSFGNKKKLGIILALMHSPKLVILDEPTTGLDPLMQQVFLDVLLEEKKSGVTIFLSSHILSEVEKICDRVGLIRDGVMTQMFEMKELSDKFHKKIETSSALNAPLLKGLTLNHEDQGIYHYEYRGDINALTKYLSKNSLDDLTIRDSSLEDVFLGFYQGEVNQDVL